MHEDLVHEPARSTRVVATADVVVCGGGPAGIAAALAAARQGARTVLLEQNAFLGGMATAGLVCLLAYGYHDKERFIVGGIFRELREELLARGALITTPRYGWEPFNPEVYKKLVMTWLAEAGVEVRANTWVADALVQQGQVKAVLTESKAGRQAIRGKVFVEATGDGDLAARAGAPYTLGRPGDGATQPMTLMYCHGNVDIQAVGAFLSQKGRRGFWQTAQGVPYLNATGYKDEVTAARAAGEVSIPREDVSSTFSLPWLPGVVGVNYGRLPGYHPLEPLDLTRAYAAGMQQAQEGLAFFRRHVPGFAQAVLLHTAPQVGIRETRRITGQYALTGEDVISQRQFDDVIAQACYQIDIHLPDQVGTTLVKLPRGTHYDIPFRCLVPTTLRNVVLAGRCISCSHEALASLRVQAIAMALGQAAGTAAALAAVGTGDVAALAVGEVQKRLLDGGAILS
jgi:hypothetical protein